MEILQRGNLEQSRSAINTHYIANGERIYRIGNEDEEPGTVLSCVIADALGTKNKSGCAKAEMQDVKTIVSRSRISAF